MFVFTGVTFFFVSNIMGVTMPHVKQPPLWAGPLQTKVLQRFFLLFSFPIFCIRFSFFSYSAYISKYSKLIY